MIAEELKLAIKSEVAQATSQLKEFNKTLDKSHGATKKADSAMGAWAKRMLTGAGIVYAFRQLARSVEAGLEAYMEEEKALAKLSSALQATGNAVGYSMQELKGFADQMQATTRFSNDAVIEAQGLMTTFTQVGHDVFPTAIKAAADMSDMFGQDLQQSVIQLGTALNDPIAGVGRLKRIGISFSEDQKQQIKQFMEANDVMSAQNVILKELQVEFGGVAEQMGQTTFGKIERLKNAFSDLQKNMGKISAELLTPVAEALSSFLSKHGTTIVAVFKNIPGIAAATFQLVVNIIKEALKWDNFKKIIGNLAIGLFNAFKIAIVRLPQLFYDFVNLVTTPMRNFGQWLISVFDNAWGNIKNAGLAAINWVLSGGGLFGEGPLKGLIDRQMIPPIQDFGEVWNQTITDMGERGAKLVTDTVGAIGELGAAFGDVAVNIAGIFQPQIQAYLANINSMVATTKKELETVGPTPAGREKPSEEEIEAVVAAIDEMEEAVGRMGEGTVTAVEFLAWQAGMTVEEYEKLKAEIEDVAKSANSAMGEAAVSIATAMGKAASSGEDAFEAMKSAGKEAIAGILDMIAQRLLVEAAEAFAAGFVPPPIGLGPAGFAAAAGFTAAAALAGVAAGAVRGMAKGGEFTTKGPELLMVGDNPGGRERVEVTPQNSPASRKMLHLTINMDSRQLYSGIHEATENGEVIIAARAVR